MLAQHKQTEDQEPPDLFPWVGQGGIFHTHTQKIILQLKIHYVEIGISFDSLWTVCPIETDQHSLREDGGQFDEGITASRCFSCQAGLRKQ